MPEKNDDTSELEEGVEVFGIVFPAHHQSSKVMQPSEEAFDLPAFAIAPQPAPIIKGRLGAAFAMRRQKQHLLVEQSLAQGIAVVGFVRNEPERLFGHEQLLERGFDQLHFGGRSSFCVDGERKTIERLRSP